MKCPASYIFATKITRGVRNLDEESLSEMDREDLKQMLEDTVFHLGRLKVAEEEIRSELKVREMEQETNAKMLKA